jgi:hypothetical protein
MGFAPTGAAMSAVPHSAIERRIMNVLHNPNFNAAQSKCAASQAAHEPLMPSFDGTNRV